MWNNEHHWGSYFPMMMGAGIMMLVFCGLVIWLVIYAIRRLSPNERPNHVDSAVDILRQRYAKGEIDVEEYRERLKELQDLSKKI
ncbi:SHOCT domain-containing protein [Pueribacillus sp. YX66]|uniref:SHOCT domain-containing protein n=1 Tax=Pueribacillus sp. YX66 TaxID=3229242 RepID=UPI00358D4B89